MIAGSATSIPVTSEARGSDSQAAPAITVARAVFRFDLGRQRLPCCVKNAERQYRNRFG